MLFGGNSGSCGGCGCKSCQECTHGCVEPHTGDPFETKYTLYFEGVEIGNPGGVYLQASGDVDTSDPYDGMEGNGPWSQTVSSTFSLSPTSSRIPCVFSASFWRSNFVLGSNTVPPPSAALTANEITITNESTSGGPILYGHLVLQPGESYTFSAGIPLVSGAGDQSANDPRSPQGSVSIRAACGNDTVTFSVGARIAWNVKKRQHVLYGIVRECYEESDIGAECAAVCTPPSSPPNEVYLTLSNFNITEVSQDTNFDGTYYSAEEMQNLLSEYLDGTFVVPRRPGYCNGFEAGSYAFATPCSPPWSFVWVMPYNSFSFMGGGSMIGVYFIVQGKTGNICFNDGISLWVPNFEPGFICGTSYSKSGTATFSTTSKTLYGANPGVSHGRNTRSSSYAGSFNWLVES